MRLRYMCSYILAGYAILSGAASFGLVPAYPSGWATTTVPLLSMIGVVAGILLLLRYRIAVPLMIIYLLPQAKVVIVDPSGPLFRQTIFWGWERVSSHSFNGVATSMHGTGENYWAWIPLIFLAAIVSLGLHPPLKALKIPPAPPWFRRARPVVLAVTALALAAYISTRDFAKRSPTVAQISCDVSGTRVWLNGHDLGRVPVTITLATLRSMHLSVDATAEPIGLHLDNWSRGFLLQTSSWQAKITFQPPANLAGQFLPFPTPWATCAQTMVEGTGMARKALLLPERTITIGVHCPLKSGYSVFPGRRFAIGVAISNPATKTCRGKAAQLEVCWRSFTDRWGSPISMADPTAGFTTLHLAQNFCELPAGATESKVITLTAPKIPGNYCFRMGYELFRPNGQLRVGIPLAYALVKVASGSSSK